MSAEVRGLGPSEQGATQLQEETRWCGRAVTWLQENAFTISLIAGIFFLFVAATATGIYAKLGACLGLLAVGTVIEEETKRSNQERWSRAIEAICGNYEQYQNLPLLPSETQARMLDLLQRQPPPIFRQEESFWGFKGLHLARISKEALFIQIRKKDDQSLALVGIMKEGPSLKVSHGNDWENLPIHWDMTEEEALTALRQIAQEKNHPTYELA